ncbi:MAG TPA: cupredoxin domain-containing protein [Dehalococcoidia bacterium]|nr:cupredoxin domain-containing protein [Dehalococcoidia bacterium]
MRKAIPVVVLVMLAAGLAAAACGGGKEKQSDGGQPAGSNTVSMEQDDFYFKPKDTTVEAGKAVTVNLKNEGKATHTFTIDELNVDQTVAPDTEATVTFTPTKAGTLAFYCKFHRGRGMEGTLTVSGGAGSSAPGGKTPATTGSIPGY